MVKRGLPDPAVIRHGGGMKEADAVGECRRQMRWEWRRRGGGVVDDQRLCGLEGNRARD
jgi:hypothetical protein